MVEDAVALQRKSSKLRIWSWNVNGRHLWDQLAVSEVDVALLQEAPVPSGLWAGKVVSHPSTGWRTAGGSQWCRTAVVAVSETTLLEPRPLTSLEERAPGALLVSRFGTLAAADVVIDGERITLVSMYAAWEGGRPGPIYADASAPQLLSDLSGIVNDAGSHRVIAAGDPNILHRYGEFGVRIGRNGTRRCSTAPRRWGCGSWGRRRPTAGRRIRGRPSCRKARGMSRRITPGDRVRWVRHVNSTLSSPLTR